jgi:hypothetical protein
MMADIERIIDDIKKYECGDYNCLLPDDQVDSPEYYADDNNKICRSCDYYIMIQALQEKAEQENLKPLTITLEQAANAIQIICDEGGCPPDTDCPHDGNCAECIKEWLISVYKPNHTVDVDEKGNHSGEATEMLHKRYIDADLLCKKLKNTADRIISDSIKMGIVPTIQNEERTDTLLDVIDLIKRFADNGKTMKEDKT